MQHILVICSFVCFLFKGFIYLSLERERKKGRETSMCGCLSCTQGPGPKSRHVPDWESNWQPFGSQACTQSTELHQPGHFCLFLNSCWNSFPASMSGKLLSERDLLSINNFKKKVSSRNCDPQIPKCYINNTRNCKMILCKVTSQDACLISTYYKTDACEITEGGMYYSEQYDYQLRTPGAFNITCF